MSAKVDWSEADLELARAVRRAHLREFFGDFEDDAWESLNEIERERWCWIGHAAAVTAQRLGLPRAPAQLGADEQHLAGVLRRSGGGE